MREKLVSPAVVLFFLAPVMGELLSSSAPPAEFFNPLSILFLGVLYGGGALLIRELTFRWEKSWPTVLVLGAAYGIAEEGLMVKSFFDPGWEDLDLLGVYGRWLGVNWVWSLYLTIFHAVFSIAIPILMVSLMFPERRAQPWISRRKFYLLFVAWVVNSVFIFFALTPYRPPLAPYLLAFIIAIGLVIVARLLPRQLVMAAPGGGERSSRFRVADFLATCALFFIGFFATTAFFIATWALLETDVPPLLTMFLVVGVVALTGFVVLVVWLALRVLGGGNVWSEKHPFALASGGLTLFILFTPIAEFDETRLDNTTGMLLVGLATVLFLIWMARRVARIESATHTT